MDEIEIGHPERAKGALNGWPRIMCESDDIVAIGDNLNDISMFEVAATRIAMVNGVDA